ncbi:uncharacterized protein IL334_004787 [Kwoniella shivajii]|uniref:Uncharacterized protein n=1 Tax=Kwoniella shivajii TaxID=564305 RepID=A0ABZ1D1X7_9TREE|nr:hypothetical protein IL334_004787 [Kwoniella shivajii]
MLRLNGSNEYINQDQLEEYQSILDNFWNGSISWTEQVNSWTELTFIGTDIWLYGISGPSYGKTQAIIDDQSQGEYDQYQNEIDHHRLLYEKHDLRDQEHKLRLINVQQGRRMAFDYAIIQSDVISDDDNNDSESTDAMQLIPEANSQPSSATQTISETTDVSTESSSSTEPTITEPALAAAQITPSHSSSIQSLPQPLNTTSSITNSNTSNLNDTSSPQTQAQAEAQAVASSAALAALLPTQYSASQLSTLKVPYQFHWNPAAYFVVIFSSFVLVLFLLFITHMILRYWLKRSGRINDGPQGDYTSGRNKRHSPLLDALHGRRIGSPMNPLKNGNANGSISDEAEDVTNGW